MENRVEIRHFSDHYMVWIKTNDGRMIEAIEYLSQAQIDEICRDYDAYIDIDERPWVQIDSINLTWEYDDEEDYMSGNFIVEDNTVIDYDGCFELPKEVVDEMIRLGYKIDL